jgi:hypothetical protein
MLPWLVAALAAAASSTVLAGDAAAPSASASVPVQSAEATKAARQEADRQRLIAKLRAESPKRTEKPKGSVLDLPIFNRYSRP